MPDTTGHVHDVDLEYPVMRIGICACGEEFEQQRKRWRAPKLTEGIRRRYGWSAKQAEQQRVEEGETC